MGARVSYVDVPSYPSYRVSVSESLCQCLCCVQRACAACALHAHAAGDLPAAVPPPRRVRRSKLWRLRRFRMARQLKKLAGQQASQD